MIRKPFVFSGGGARGFAHLGVAKALEEKGVFPSAISGTSAGAVAGAFLSNGFSPEEVIELLGGKLSRRMMGWHSLRTGLMSFKGVADFLQNNLRYKTFEQLPIPLYITATSFVDGQQRIFHEGSIIDAICASCAIPAIFPAYEIDDIPYVDGALANNLPVEPFLKNKQDIIAVHVNPIWDLNGRKGLRAIVERAFNLSFVAITKQSAEGCLMFIEPKALIDYNLFDLGRSSDIIEIGYNYAVHYLEQNPELLKDEKLLKKFRRNFNKLLQTD